jgi:hypothetical protein
MEIYDASDALERLVLEVDALTSIICDNNFTSDDSSQHDNKFIITTPESLVQAREYIESTGGQSPNLRNTNVPSIGIEALVCSNDEYTTDGIRLRICLPPGYPSHVSAEVTVLSTPKDFPKNCLDKLSSKVSNRTKEMIGGEVMMEVINECRDALEEWKKSLEATDIGADDGSIIKQSSTKPLSRRWIWVHHITNLNRIKQIVQEAKQLHLGGYVKGGYPGVVVIEGMSHSCDDFVIWIKGNKSRPGGFGRNWGHHVRGETTIHIRQFPESFEELEDDMGRLGGLCRDYGVEEEFREFILQHKYNNVK